ncbi:AfsR/SARP family transcriptional regulator [Actinocrispum wychmicini]|uniref:DNA-binding SARP family transcriptional activator n=1 Tax=Actinocrispum wychmicini TaxID=1213861 RepID=A0A4V2S7Q1_9PSEU|nr:BTAD domain-containing putative transcriptional regulator [Actinocrispum wychmicini]TCO60930.1 DNA-binding SARP family transcriptional activator [Actinocrispum wychmicini]
MNVEVRVLGDVEVRIEDHPVDIGHSRQLVVLAGLLVDANRVVSIDQLVDRVWGEQPPRRARGTLSTYLTRLRQGLAAAPDVTIARRPGGYALTVEPELVDLHRFRQLINQAHDADDEHALASLDQALQLWRGDAFAHLDSPWLGTVREALNRERFAAQLDHNDLHLRRGGHARLLPDLTAQASEHPWDERLAAQLMLALYRAGRQTEALQAFHDTKRRLSEDLGVDPGAELRELHTRILRGTADLPKQPAAPMGRNDLPGDVADFTGREQELHRLLAVLPDRHDDTAARTVVIEAIDGMAGVGKTTLAVHTAHQLVQRYPDAQLFIDLHGHTTDQQALDPMAALDTLLRALNVPGERIPHTLDARAALWRAELATRTALVVLDNAYDITQIRLLLPGSPRCLTLITSRRRLLGLDGANVLSLDVLPRAEAVTLFTRILTDHRAAAEPDAVNEVMELCGDLPLAIRVAAARLRTRPAWTISHLADRLRDGHRRLAELSAEDRSVAATFSLSYQHLTADQQRLFRLLGLHPGHDIDAYAAAALADIPLDMAENLLESLVDAHLLLQPRRGRYRFHDLLRHHAHQTACDTDPEPDRRAALDRLFGHYAYTTSVAMDLAHPWDATYPWEADQRRRPPATDTPTPSLDDDVQAVRWLDTELDNLLAAAHHAAGHGRPDHTSEQATALHRHLHIRGRDTAARALNDLALHRARETGNRLGELNALLALATIHTWQGRPEQAADSSQQALAIALEAGNRTGEQLALHALGDAHKARNQFAPATDYLKQALAIALQTGNRIAEQDVLLCLGRIHRSLRRYEEATDCYRRVLAIDRDLSHHSGQQSALQGLGDVHWLQGRHQSAADTYRQVLAMARATGNPIREQFALCGLGNVHRELGQFELAADYCQQALTIAHSTGDPECQFEAHQGLGRISQATGDHLQALDHHHTALDLATDLGHPADQARAHDGLAHAHQALGDTTRSRRHWQAALDILTGLDLGHADEPGLTTATIRTHLAAGANP